MQPNRHPVVSHGKRPGAWPGSLPNSATAGRAGYQAGLHGDGHAWRGGSTPRPRYSGRAGRGPWTSPAGEERGAGQADDDAEGTGAQAHDPWTASSCPWFRANNGGGLRHRTAGPQSSGQGIASTAAPRARTPVSLTAVSDGRTVRLFRGQSVSVALRGTALSWHIPAATGHSRTTNQCQAAATRVTSQRARHSLPPGRAARSSAALTTSPACTPSHPAQSRNGHGALSCSSRGHIRKTSSWLIKYHHTYRLDGLSAPRRGVPRHRAGQRFRPAPVRPEPHQ